MGESHGNEIGMKFPDDLKSQLIFILFFLLCTTVPSYCSD